jgi:hypothetical protein
VPQPPDPTGLMEVMPPRYLEMMRKRRQRKE